MQQITTFLTFEKDGAQAIEFYLSIFKNSKLNSKMVLPNGQLIHASFELNGQGFMAMDGGDYFKFAEGMSLFVSCDGQEEVDYYWEQLTANGGEPGQCGWLKDRFGVSWQIIPTDLGELMSSGDQGQSIRVREAMLKMNKIDIAGLKQASYI